MRPIASDFATGGGALVHRLDAHDALRVAGHVPVPRPRRRRPGRVGRAVLRRRRSRRHDAGAERPHRPDAGARRQLERRSPRSPPARTSRRSGRYLQYRVEATSASGAVTPTLSSVTLPFTAAPDTTAPTITGRIARARGRPTSRSARTSPSPSTSRWSRQPIGPSAVTLRAEGSGTDVAGDGHGQRRDRDPRPDRRPDTEHRVHRHGRRVGGRRGRQHARAPTTPGRSRRRLRCRSSSTTPRPTSAPGRSGAGTYVSVTGDGEVILAPTVGRRVPGRRRSRPAGRARCGPAAPEARPWAAAPSTVDGALLATDAHVRARPLARVRRHLRRRRASSTSASASTSTAWPAGPCSAPTTPAAPRCSPAPTTAAPPPTCRSRPASSARRTGTASTGPASRWCSPSTAPSCTPQPVAITGDMRPVVSDFNAGGAAVVVDWLRMSPYAASGTFTSRVLDAGAPVDWRTLDVTDTTPPGTAISYEVRTGDTTDPDDGTWSAFTPVADGGDIPGTSRYAQYRADAEHDRSRRRPRSSSGWPSATSGRAAPSRHRRRRRRGRGRRRHGGPADPGDALGAVAGDGEGGLGDAPQRGPGAGRRTTMAASGTLTFLPGDDRGADRDHGARRRARRARRALRRRVVVRRSSRPSTPPSARGSSAPSPTASSSTTTRHRSSSAGSARSSRVTPARWCCRSR